MPRKDKREEHEAKFQKRIAELEQAGVVRTPKQSRDALRRKVRMFYDLQRMRLQVAGRLQPRPEEQAVQLHEYDLELLRKRLEELLAAEKSGLKDVEKHLESIPFYMRELSVGERWRGIGPTMAAVILSEFDIEKADTPSKFWKYAGLAPRPAVRCKGCHSVVEDQEDDGIYHHKQAMAFKDGERIKCPYEGPLSRSQTYASGKSMRPTKGEKLPYNSFLRSKLMGVLGPIMLKLGSPYRKQYDDYKFRWQSAGKGRNDGHRHMAAIRYMVKMMLADLWNDWRIFEGLDVRPTYQEEKLGHVHNG